MSNSIISTPNKRTPIHSFYVLKAIAAFVVVCCHFPFYLIDNYLIVILQTAVPIFLLISGYFLYHPSTETMVSKAKRMLLKTCQLFLIVNLFYFLWLLPKNGNVLNSWDSIGRLFLFGNSLSAHLWYLTALIQALLFLFLYLKYRGNTRLWIFPPLVLLSQIGIHSTILFGVSPQFFYYLNVLCCSIPYLVMGILIHQYEAKLTQFSHWGKVALLCLALMYLEYYLCIQLYTDMGLTPLLDRPYLFGTLFTVALLCWALRHQDFGARSIVSRIGERYSATIYYFHVAVGTIIVLLLKFLGDISTLYSLFGAGIVFLGSLALSWAIYRIQQRLGWHIF